MERGNPRTDTERKRSEFGTNQAMCRTSALPADRREVFNRKRQQVEVEPETAFDMYIFFSHRDIKSLSIYLSIYQSILFVRRALSKFIDKHTVKYAPVFRQEDSDREKKAKGNFFAHTHTDSLSLSLSLLCESERARVCSNSHRNSSARAYGRFLSTTMTRATTTTSSTTRHITTYKQKCRFHVRIGKELGLRQDSQYQKQLFSQPCASHSLSLFLFSLTDDIEIYIFSLSLPYHERATASPRHRRSRLLLLRFSCSDDDDDNDSRNVIFPPLYPLSFLLILWTAETTTLVFGSLVSFSLSLSLLSRSLPTTKRTRVAVFSVIQMIMMMRALLVLFFFFFFFSEKGKSSRPGEDFPEQK